MKILGFKQESLKFLERKALHTENASLVQSVPILDLLWNGGNRMHTKDNYEWLDRFRLPAALLVVAIHTSPLGAFSPEGDFFLTRVLARIAVPFFFMVTGQFTVGKLIPAGNEPNRRACTHIWRGSKPPLPTAGALIASGEKQSEYRILVRYLRKILILYLASILLYLPVGIYAGHYRNMTFVSILKMILFDGTFYHLWYFPACLLGIVLVYLMSRFLKLRGILILSAALYLAGLLGDSYYGLIQKLPILEKIYTFFFHICSYTRNGLFFAPLFLALGAWCAKDSRRRISIHLTTLILSFLLMTGEAFTLRHFSWQRHDSMYLMLIPVMISLYRLLQQKGNSSALAFIKASASHPTPLCGSPFISCEGAPLMQQFEDHALCASTHAQSVNCCMAEPLRKRGKYFRSASLWIYILHPAFIIVVRGAAKILHLTPLLVENSLVHYLAVSALSVGAGFGITFLAAPVRALYRKAFSASRCMTFRCTAFRGMISRGMTSHGTAPFCATSFRKPSFCMTSSYEPSSRGRAWIELDKTALAGNVEYLRSLMPEGCRLMPALKANAYGHGAVWAATVLNQLGVDAFCVACLSEGIALRKAKVKGEILILGYTAPEDLSFLSRYRLTQTIVDYGYAEELEHAGITLHIHIGIDTGMHRLGIRCEETEHILGIFEMKHLIVDGMFTHLCACDSPLPENRTFTESQIEAFYQVADLLEEQGIPCPKLHLQSSYGLLNYPGLDADYVRAGIALYGVPSSTENEIFGNTPNETSALPHNLSPVLSLKARVISVRSLYAGESAGYSLAFTAEKDMRAAVLSIGYADGLPRELSCGRGHVLLHGCRAPIIGRICMDLTLVDVSHIPQVSAGDTAVLIGTSGEQEITATELASRCGTITNELLSRLGERLERIEK